MVQNRVENIRYKKSHPASQSPNPDYIEVGSEDDDVPLYPPYHHRFTPLPAPEPELRLLQPDEKIDFGPIKHNFDFLQDQMVRLLQTLEASRREVEELKKERDELLEFKNQTVGFYSMMHRGISNFAFTPQPTPQPTHQPMHSNPFLPTMTVHHPPPSNQILHADFGSPPHTLSTSISPITPPIIQTASANTETTPAVTASETTPANISSVETRAASGEVRSTNMSLLSSESTLVQATGQSMEAESQADNVPGSVIDKPKETSATEMSHHGPVLFHQIENQLSGSDRSQEDEAALAAILGEASGKDVLGSDESYNF